eukprot:COSAG02_NODE_3042_length_7484_cov_13.494110_3_plen_62_part_00
MGGAPTVWEAHLSQRLLVRAKAQRAVEARVGRVATKPLLRKHAWCERVAAEVVGVGAAAPS